MLCCGCARTTGPQSLDTSSNETQVLTLSPTRELAEQSQKVCLALGDYMNVQCHACIGGKSIAEDIRRLDYGVQVGTFTSKLALLALLLGSRTAHPHAQPLPLSSTPAARRL